MSDSCLFEFCDAAELRKRIAELDRFVRDSNCYYTFLPPLATTGCAGYVGAALTDEKVNPDVMKRMRRAIDGYAHNNI